MQDLGPYCLRIPYTRDPCLGSADCEECRGISVSSLHEPCSSGFESPTVTIGSGFLAFDATLCVCIPEGECPSGFAELEGNILDFAGFDLPIDFGTYGLPSLGCEKPAPFSRAAPFNFVCAYDCYPEGDTAREVAVQRECFSQAYELSSEFFDWDSIQLSFAGALELGNGLLDMAQYFLTNPCPTALAVPLQFMSALADCAFDTSITPFTGIQLEASVGLPSVPFGCRC